MKFDSGQRSKIFYILCAFFVSFVAASASFNGFYDGQHFFDDATRQLHGRCSFEAAVDGTDDRPYVYRQLLPMAVNFVNARLSSATLDALYNLHNRAGILLRTRLIDSPVMQDKRYFVRYWLMYNLVFIFAWLAVGGAYLSARACGVKRLHAFLAALVFILIVPYLQIRLGHFYDYPEIFFFTIAVWLCVRGPWLLLLPMTVLATLNKESYLLFVVTLYPFLAARFERRKAFSITGSMFVVSAAVYEWLKLLFRNNPGGGLELHISEQWHAFLTLFMPWHSSPIQIYGIWSIPLYSLPGILGFLWAVIACWPILPQAFRYNVLVSSLINLPLFFICCNPAELRDLSLLYPGVIAIIALQCERFSTLWHEEQQSLT